MAGLSSGHRHFVQALMAQRVMSKRDAKVLLRKVQETCDGEAAMLVGCTDFTWQQAH